jgi:hypothetical protein
MCKNTNEGIDRHRHRPRPANDDLCAYPPSFGQTILPDNEDMIYINNDSQLFPFFVNSIYDGNYVSENDSKLPS